jgi:Na+/melibiose symporter-like transporter
MSKSEVYDKSDHHIVVNTFQENEIIGETFATPIAGLLTLLFLFQKINDNFMSKWQVCFYPLFVLFAYKFLVSFIRILRTDNGEIDENSTEKDFKFKLRIKNIEKIILISNFFSLINSALSAVTVFYAAEFMDRKEDDYLFLTIYMIAALCISHLIYTLIRKTTFFSIKREGYNIYEENGAGPNSSIAFLSSLTAPALTYLSNMMIICNGGACTQIYASTIASLLGAFGVSVADFSEYLFPITIVLLSVSCFSLYIKKGKLDHPPFLLGVFASAVILLSHIFEEKIGFMTYPGNALMIGAAIWNARINKFSGLPRFSK